MRKVFILLKDREPEEIKSYIAKLYNVQKMIDNENYEGFYNEKLFINLLNHLPKDNAYPSLPTIRNAFSGWTDFLELGDPVDVNFRDIILSENILGICVLFPDELIIDHIGLGNNICLNEMKEGQFIKTHKIELVECDEIKVNEWFNENREPKREFDEEYIKHSRFKTRYVDGEEVSPLTLPEEEIEIALKKAVGTRGQKRIYFYDKGRKLLIVFYYENSCSYYHGHEIKKENIKKEEQKICESTHKKLKKIFNYRRK